MSDTEQVAVSPEESLRRHVLDPVAAAENVVNREYTVVNTERRAFEQFGERVAAIETVTTGLAVPGPRSSLREDRSHGAERVRSAYRETVMDVAHYDDVYGETLVEHVGAELSDELAAGLRRDASQRFTPLFKQTLRSAVEGAIDQRQTVCTILDSERQSLDRGQDELRVLLNEVDGTRVPASDGAGFTDALDEIARHRQETLVSRTASPRTDGHDLCGYLYTDCDWTYPVLTAVARLRGSVNGAVA